MTNSAASGDRFAIKCQYFTDLYARWDMGTCFPNAILGEGGYLASHQNSLQRLSLISDGNCVTGSPPFNEFAKLRDLSWKGVRGDADCAALKECLEKHHERLIALEIDFIDWAEIESYFDLSDELEDEDDESTPLIDLIIPERIDDSRDFLPNLQTFLLSASSFKGSWDLLINVFNLRNVKVLRLHNCKLAVEMLDYMAQTDVALQATQVELVLRRSELIGMECEVIDFLAPFDSLKDLFLMFYSDYTNEYYFQMILRHRDTLRRLVYHRRHYCMADKAPYWQEYCDSSLEETEGDGFADIFRETKLERLGVCGEPSKLQESFHSMASTVHSLKLLHLRFTGKAERKPKFFKESEAYGDNSPSPEFTRAYFEAQRNGTTPPQRSPGPSKAELRIRWEQLQGENWREDEEKELEAFANWAFGSDGFPRLQVLASGDFSYRNRFVDTHTLWCRKTRGSRRNQTWRPVEPNDIAENELIDANMDMMSACPVSPLFYRSGRGDVFPGIA